MTIISLVVAFGCGKSDGPGAEMRAGGTEGKAAPDKAGADHSPDGKPGTKPGAKMEDIDVDKLNIPDNMKEAIKSGKIPPEQVKAMLARMGQGGGGGDAAAVNVGNVTKKDLNSYLVLNGIVEPERKVEIFSRLSAYVKQINKEEGDYVKNNEVLATLDDTEVRTSYQQAQIQLDQAKLSLEEQEKNFERSKELIKKDLISEQEFQTTESAYKQAQLEHANRQENFKDLQLQLNWTRIRALSEGYITERLIEVGTKVNANQQVYTIEDFKPLLIRVFVPTSDSIQLRTGMLSEVTTEVLAGTVFNGNVKLINPRIDVETGTVKVTVEVNDESMRLKPGMFVEVRIVIGKKEGVLAIPRKAILYKQNKTYVFVVNHGQVSQREVALGLIEEDMVEITSGLETGEVIVIVGVEGLEDGERVEVVQ
jgi:RND family efflux transporter MFP subunit